MTLGRDILYAALAGLMHVGLTVYPARWAGLRDAAPLALWDGPATGNLAARVGLKNVAPLALWDRREIRNRQCRLSASQVGWKHIAPLALWSRPKGPLSLSPRHRLGSANIHNVMRPEGPR
jgi:hypothetical protein